MKKKILVFVDWFEPGFRAGGPIRSCVNFVEGMKNDYEVFVFTSDRDLGAEHPYDEVEQDKWLQRDGYNILYASPSFLKWKNILSQTRQLKADYIYLNSMFSRFFSIYPLLFRRLGKTKSKIMLSPRGMLRETAMGFKPFKKKLFLNALKSAGIPGQVNFHATDPTELIDIRKNFGTHVSVAYIPNFPGIQKEFIPPPAKLKGELKTIFVGRIHPIKNLHLLLQQAKLVNAAMHLTILGTVEDHTYWESCRNIIESLPEGTHVELLSDIPHHRVESILLQHHLFTLPTQGENFGHSIYESLAAGRPVLISDQTPWRDLARCQAGWDLSLREPSAFAKAMQDAADMTTEELTQWCNGAWQYCNRFIKQSGIKEKYLALFN